MWRSTSINVTKEVFINNEKTDNLFISLNIVIPIFIRYN